MVEHFLQHYPNIIPTFENCADKNLIDIFIDNSGLSTLGHPRNNVNSLWMNSVFQNAGKNNMPRILSGQKGNTFISYHAPHLHYQHFLKMKWGKLAREIINIAQKQGTGIYNAVKVNVFGHVKSELQSALNRFRYKTLRDHPFIQPSLFSSSILDSLNWDKIKQQLDYFPNYTKIGSSRDYRLSLMKIDDPDVGMYTYYSAQQFGVEVADPTSDARLAAFSINIPAEVWNSGGIRKKLYIQSFSDKIPKLILNNPVRMLQSTDISYRFKNENVGQKLINILSEHKKIAEITDIQGLKAIIADLDTEQDWQKKHRKTSQIVFHSLKLLYLKKILSL